MTTWLTAKAAAQHATVSEWTIRQAVKDGELPAYPVGKTGRGYRLTAEDVDGWLKSRSYEPPSERHA
jgi:excisionase family DNA binding protein